MLMTILLAIQGVMYFNVSYVYNVHSHEQGNFIFIFPKLASELVYNLKTESEKKRKTKKNL